MGNAPHAEQPMLDQGPFGKTKSGLGMLLVGHGSRDILGRQSFLDLAACVAEQLPEVPVVPGFLELCEPTLADAWQALMQRGVEQVRAVPAILFAAGHAKQDIPAALEAVAGRPLPLAAHLGLHAAVLQRSRQITDQLLAAQEPLPAARQGLLLVGRGSSDPEAIAQMHALGQQRRQADRFAVQLIGFVAKAEPTLKAQLDRLGRMNLERVVVQPHLLFGGRVYDEIAEQVVEASFRFAQQQWLLAAPLGPDPLIAQSLRDRFTEVPLGS